MRTTLVVLLLSICPVGLVTALSLADTAASGKKKPYGIEKRVPWTTSRVIGSPNCRASGLSR